RGQVIANPCTSCHGNGRVEQEKVLSVKVPAGVDSGDRIRLAGEGEAGPAGTPPGDLYVEVRVRPHDIFERDGDDLHCDVPIRISQAALGDVIRVPTLEGEVELRIPAETQTGKVFRLRDKGVKSVRSRAPGDLYCKAVVETPVNLSVEQREILEAFEATFVGEGARRHSPRASTCLDGVTGFWDRMVSSSRRAEPCSAILHEWTLPSACRSTAPPAAWARRCCACVPMPATDATSLRPCRANLPNGWSMGCRTSPRASCTGCRRSTSRSTSAVPTPSIRSLPCASSARRRSCPGPPASMTGSARRWPLPRAAFPSSWLPTSASASPSSPTWWNARRAHCRAGIATSSN